MANLVELHYFNNPTIYFQLPNPFVKRVKDNQNTSQIRMEDINNFFGDMDLFLLDLLLKASIQPGKILEIGFGTGRNLIHFLQRDEFEVYGTETDQSLISLIQLMISGFKNQDPNRFQLASATKQPFGKEFFQTVICARVFHFLNDQEKIEAWEEIHNVLSPGGVLYLTANSMINFENRSEPAGEGKHTFPDGTIGYFLTEDQLDRMIEDPRFEKQEPVRNLQYDDQHAETILVFRKK